MGFQEYLCDLGKIIDDVLRLYNGDFSRTKLPEHSAKIKGIKTGLEGLGSIIEEAKTAIQTSDTHDQRNDLTKKIQDYKLNIVMEEGGPAAVKPFREIQGTIIQRIIEEKIPTINDLYK